MKKDDVTHDGVVYHAGFPNAAEDGLAVLSLDALAIRHRASTYLWRLAVDVPELQWQAGSIVVVDRALPPKHSDTVVVVAGNEFAVCQLKKHADTLITVGLDGGTRVDTEVWGVITYVLGKVRS